VAPTGSLSQCKLSVQHILTSATTLAVFTHIQWYISLLAAVSLSKMIVLETGHSPGVLLIMPSVVKPFSGDFWRALHFSAVEEGYFGSSCNDLFQLQPTVPGNWCHRDRNSSDTDISSTFLISEPFGVVGSPARMDLAFLFMIS